MVIPPYCFRRQRDGIHEDDKAYFVCKFCDSYAHATLNFDDDGNKKYSLIQWPTSHDCMPDPTQYLIEIFSPMCYEEVAANPTKPIGQIYKDVRTKLAAELDDDDKSMFFSGISSLSGIQKGLYVRREDYIPKRPETFAGKNIQSKFEHFQFTSNIFFSIRIFALL